MSDAPASQEAGRRMARPPRRGMKLAALAIGVAGAAVLFEVSLRVLPGVISPRLLILFEPGLRARIASGDYPLQKDFRRIDRDDGGPPLFAARPNTRIQSIDPVPDGSERFTDELGFCNPPGRYDGHERLDVLALGDSFTWCHAVVPGDAWPALLGDRTGAATYSLGLGGKGPYEYVQFLREFGLAKKPRVVILNVYGGNDLRDAGKWKHHRDALARGEEPPTGEPVQVAPGLAPSVVGRHSYALNLALAALSRALHRDPGDAEKGGVDFRYRIRLPGGKDVDFNVENRDRDEVVFARRAADGRTPVETWDEAFERLGRLAREHGFAAVVSYTPSAWSAYAGRTAFEDPALRDELERFDRAQRSYLEARAEADGFLFHDLTPDLRRAAEHGDASGLLYDPVHIHLTARGNDAVAASLADFLEARALLGAGGS